MKLDNLTRSGTGSGMGGKNNARIKAMENKPMIIVRIVDDRLCVMESIFAPI